VTWNESSLLWRPRFSRGSNHAGSGVVSRSSPTNAALLCLGLALAFASGCGRTVLVPESSPVRIGPDVQSRVYTLQGGEWMLSDNKVALPEGWYCVPPSFVEEP
jgi:hypothetical protein